MTGHSNQQRFDRALGKHKGLYFRVVHTLQIGAGLVLLFVSTLFGADRLSLIIGGVHAFGKVVDTMDVTFKKNRHRPGSRSTSTGKLPIVEFVPVGSDVPVRFKDWVADKHHAGSTVPVIYDLNDPEFAAINHGALNWIPWAPIAAVALFLILAGLRGWLSSPRD